MSDLDARLARLRGSAQPKRHTARTIAAMTANPGCSRRAVLDAAGVDKGRLATQVGFPARFGQSRFAITRGNAFEAQIKADGCAELLSLLREKLDLPLSEVGYQDLESLGNESNADRHARAREAITNAATEAGTLFDHPLLRMEVGGRAVYLEPDLIAFRLAGRFHVVEIKSFPVIDGQADPAKVAAAAIQSAVYVLAMRTMLEEQGLDPATVSHDIVLVCPKDFANSPAVTLVDVRKQLTVLRRQLSRMARIEELLDLLPDDLTVDPRPDADGVPTATPEELGAALHRVDARYAPECLSHCEIAYFCRHEARGETSALGRAVREDLGGIESIDTALALARETRRPTPEQEESAALLRAAARLRAEVSA
ncbi:hypothetical protein GCM10009682_59810 [Luedemannella flava]|uniref:Secreted protein n=1 Tax=Luedemannella flava TaxID=349316 RepID=A0ABN2MNN1_9ACTN